MPLVADAGSTPPEVHHGNDDNFLGINSVQETEREPPYQPATDIIANGLTCLWVLGYLVYSILDFT